MEIGERKCLELNLTACRKRESVVGRERESLSRNSTHLSRERERENGGGSVWMGKA